MLLFPQLVIINSINIFNEIIAKIKILSNSFNTFPVDGIKCFSKY